MFNKNILEQQLHLNTDNFLNHHHNIYIEKRERLLTRAYDADLKNKSKNIVGVLGEFFEREILINANCINETELSAVSLLNGESTTVKTKKVVFHDEFIDSCGMASHSISSEVIKSAFKEFYERQSLIFSYLSENPGIKLIIDFNKNIKKYDSYILNFCDNNNYFIISIDNAYYVVIAICLGKIYNAVGLGTDENIERSVIKAQKEVLQYFASYNSKYNHLTKPLSKMTLKDEYHSSFESLSQEDIYSEYKYLFEKSREVVIDKIINVERNNSLNEKIIELNKKYLFNPFIVIVPSFRKNINNLKAVKVFDFKWFPHMNIKMYNKNLFSNIEKYTKTKLNRSKKRLPFA